MILFYVFFLCCVTFCTCSLREPVDLSWSFDNKTLYWKGSQHFVFTKQIAEKNEKGFFYASNDYCSSEHGGTHLDAPYHFDEKGIKVGDIPLDKLIVNGFTIDLTAEVSEGGPAVNLEVSHINKWIEKHGVIPNNSVMLVKFGWSKYWPYEKTYFGISQKNPDVYNFPGISPEAAQWIVEIKKIVGVGTDTASVDAGTTKNFETHRILNQGGLYILENVNMTTNLPCFTIDLSAEVSERGPGVNLEVSHINKWIEKNGVIPNNSVMLVKFGWSKYWPYEKTYFGISQKNPDVYNFPGISPEAAQRIVEIKKIVGVGTDTASADPGTSNNFEAHKILSEGGLYILENVNMTTNLPSRDFTLFVMPMKIQNGTGAPARILATPMVNFVNQ